ncbi:RnfABCDGE type electron transport complex subunit B [Nevskia sp.]|uniref:RnfABCDGE type electron transport complex subunit B n=1 Tax=Nevskia sp. TaxID=1929292 RepID=UPI0025DC5007|nr:RnfABCDGE type electron transport complex subunit B [Nevskia sp.]
MNGVAIADLITRLDALLPQTQCRRCGFDGCRPYAEALANNSTTLNRCPPGGLATITALAAALDQTPLSPDPTVWPDDAPLTKDQALIQTIAVIDETRCIGCYKCVLVCPVDAILGAPKFLHVVIDEDCSGCDLCLPPCPVDCIALEVRPAALTPAAAMAERWRKLHERRKVRLAREREQRDEARRLRRGEVLAAQAKEIDIGAAIARARLRRQQTRP